VPIYVYRCRDCGADLERRQGFQDPPLTECATCGGALRRVLQPVGVIFRGSGFYTTDYPSSSRGGDGDGATSSKDGESAPAKAEPSTESGAKSQPAASTSSSGSSKSD